MSSHFTLPVTLLANNPRGPAQNENRESLCKNQEFKSVTAEPEAEPRARAAAGHMAEKPAVGTGQRRLFLLYFGPPTAIRGQRRKKPTRSRTSGRPGSPPRTRACVGTEFSRTPYPLPPLLDQTLAGLCVTTPAVLKVLPQTQWGPEVQRRQRHVAWALSQACVALEPVLPVAPRPAP